MTLGNEIDIDNCRPFWNEARGRQANTDEHYNLGINTTSAMLCDPARTTLADPAPTCCTSSRKLPWHLDQGGVAGALVIHAKFNISPHSQPIAITSFRAGFVVVRSRGFPRHCVLPLTLARSPTRQETTRRVRRAVHRASEGDWRHCSIPSGANPAGFHAMTWHGGEWGICV